MAVNISIASWAPPGESSFDLFTERTNLDGAVLGGVAYGIFICLYFTTLRQQFVTKRKKLWQIIYLNVLLTFSTIYFGASTKWAQQMFIDYRNYHLDNTTTSPEATGPLGFYNQDYNTPMIILGNAAYVVLNFASDGLVLYRALLIWNYNWFVMAFPLLILLAQTAMSIITVWNNSLPLAHFFGATSKAFASSWVIMSMSLNIILSCLIIGRIMFTRRRLVAAYGARHAGQYTSIGAIVVESAAIYAFLELLFIIFFEQLGPAISFVNIILPLLTQAMCIAPTLILLRIAREKAFTRETALAMVTGVGSTVGLSPLPADVESRISTHDDKVTTHQ